MLHESTLIDNCSNLPDMLIFFLAAATDTGRADHEIAPTPPTLNGAK
jgi:hypothetical protein